MSNLYLCKRCRNDYAVWPEDLCGQCRAEIAGLEAVNEDIHEWVYVDMNEPPVDPEDTADIQLLFDEDEND